MRSSAPLAVLVLLLAGAACRRAPAPGAASTPPLDRQLVALDRTAPYTAFDGRGGSIILGPGWTRSERTWSRLSHLSIVSGLSQPFAWTVDGEAVVWVERPPARELDLYLEARPFWWEGAPPQVMSVVADGRELAAVTLGKGWRAVRLPLPEDGLCPGWNELRLRFSRANRPDDVDGSGDTRRLCAAVRFLAVAPRELDNPRQLAELGEALARRRLALPAGACAVFVVPDGSEVTLELGQVQSRCDGCALELELLPPVGDSKVLWRGDPASASHLEISFATPEGGPSRLGITVAAGRGVRAFDLARLVEIDLGERFVRATPRSSRREGPPDVFIYLVDALRADALAPYGGSGDVSPRIAAFAGEAVVYSNAWTASSWTLPAVVSVLTGVYPDRHGVMQGDVKLAADDVRSLGALLKERGYGTLAISQSFVASAHFGIDAGFDRFMYHDQLNGSELRSQEVRRHLLHWLLTRARPERPVFAYLHTVDPHAPYTPPDELRHLADRAPGRLGRHDYDPLSFMLRGHGEDPEEVAHLRALYDGEVAYTDQEFGRFVDMLEWLGLYEQSMVVLVSDHGEEFGEHGGFDHGRTLYDELLRVPLIVKYPGGRWAGSTVEHRVSLVDLVPTVLELVGDDDDDLELDGRSLLPPRLEPAALGDRVIWAEVNPTASEHLASVDYRAVALGELKCIENLAELDQFNRPAPRWQSFDLGSDPGEREPLAEDSTRARQCRQLLETWLARRGVVAGVSTEPTDDAALEQLRALGYLE